MEGSGTSMSEALAASQRALQRLSSAGSQESRGGVPTPRGSSSGGRAAFLNPHTTRLGSSSLSPAGSHHSQDLQAILFPHGSVPPHSLSRQGSAAQHVAAFQQPQQSPGGALLTTRQADAYVSELLSYSLERLRKEPELLLNERERMERALLHASVLHYRAFIDGATCLTTVRDELATVANHLDVLSADALELASRCEAFSRDATAVLAAHGANKQLLVAHPTLLELLEAPQLMDTCVRNGLHDEALDLHAFMSRLELLHGDLPVVQLLMRQVREVLSAMLQQLLGRLQSSIQLPECLRVIGYLRRMASHTERELRAQFLSCREAWLAGLVGELETAEPYEYLKQLTNVYRVHLFDVVMQYRAVFFDSSTAAEDGGASGSLSGGGGGYGGGGGVTDSAVLYSWVQHRIAHYLGALEHHLPLITEGGNLASILEHCMYCGASLGRVGLDFRALLQPVFESCVLRLFAASLTHSIDTFTGRLEAHKWLPLTAPVLPKAPSVASATVGDPIAGGEESLAPPYALMEHAPLAILVNGFLTALNELRQCAPAGLQQQLQHLLESALERSAAAVLQYKHTRTLSQPEAALFRSAAGALAEVVLPYITACFVRVYPGSASAVDTRAAATFAREAAAA